MSAENRANIPDDEIDLKSIGGKIYSFFAYPLVLLFSNILITLCFVAAALIFSFVFKYAVSKTYSANFIVRPTDIKDKLYLKVLNDLPVLLKQGDKTTLATLLQIDTSVAADLVSLNLKPSAKIPGDSTNTVEIEIESRSNSSMVPVQNGVLQYLENNPYYAKIKALQKKQIELNLDQIDRDLAQLDSLKKLQLALYQGGKTGPQTVMLNELINPAAAYTASSERLTKKSTLLAQTAFLDRFILIKGCVVSAHHSWPPRLLILLLFSVPVFLLLCVIYLHSRRVRVTSRNV